MKEKTKEKKKLGYLNLIGLGIGGAIGTGIFMMLGYGIAYTGRSIILVCGLGCFLMLLAFWSAGAMGSLFILKGGDYTARSMIFPPLLTGVSAWFQIVGCFVLAGHSLAIAQFAGMAVPWIAEHQTISAMLILILGFLCAIKGSKVLATIQNLIVVALIIALALFVFFGLPKVDASAFFTNADGGFMQNGIGGFISALSVMSFACMGTAANTALAVDTKNPKRTIPLAAWIVTAIVGVIYAFMAYVAAGVLPYEQIAGQNISVTAEVVMPHAAYMFFVVGGGIFAISSTMLSCIAVMANPIMSVSADGWIPKAFLKTTKSGIPWVTYVVMFVVSCIPIMTGLDIEGVIGNVMVPTMIINTFVNFYCLKIPDLYPKQWENRGVRYPRWLWNAFSVIGGVFAIVVIYNTFTNMELKGMILCVIEVAVMFGFSFITLKKGWVSKEQLAATKQAAIEEALATE